MINIIRKNAVTLAIFAAITTGLTATINYCTKSSINKKIFQQQQSLLHQVIPKNLYNNDLQKECYLIKNKKALGNDELHHLYIARKGNKLIAAAIETVAPDGYAGVIKLLVGATFQGKILGIRVIEHHETAGLGDKITLDVSNWIKKQFNGKIIDSENNHDFAVKKDGGSIDQFTGATITPRAVVNATKRTVLFIKTLPKKLSQLIKCKCHDGLANE